MLCQLYNAVHPVIGPGKQWWSKLTEWQTANLIQFILLSAQYCTYNISDTAGHYTQALKFIAIVT